jgi:hypothetical protein
MITLADAEERRQQLTLEIQGIQAQLGDRQRTDDQGRRLSSNEYWAWKKRAQHALNQKLDELRLVKSWIRENQRETPAVELARHIGVLCQLFDELKTEDVEFDLDELDKIDAARRAAESVLSVRSF